MLKKLPIILFSNSYTFTHYSYKILPIILTILPIILAVVSSNILQRVRDIRNISEIVPHSFIESDPVGHES